MGAGGSLPFSSVSASREVGPTAFLDNATRKVHNTLSGARGYLNGGRYNNNKNNKKKNNSDIFPTETKPALGQTVDDEFGEEGVTPLPRNIVLPRCFLAGTVPWTGLEGEEDAEVTPCFSCGLLYRIVSRDGTWDFHNATTTYRMDIEYTFAGPVRAAGRTLLTRKMVKVSPSSVFSPALEGLLSSSTTVAPRRGSGVSNGGKTSFASKPPSSSLASPPMSVGPALDSIAVTVAQAVCYPGETIRFIARDGQDLVPSIYASKIQARAVREEEHAALMERWRVSLEQELRDLSEVAVAEARRLGGGTDDALTEEGLLAACVAHGCLYVDRHFLPGPASIGRDDILQRALFGVHKKEAGEEGTEDCIRSSSGNVDGGGSLNIDADIYSLGEFSIHDASQRSSPVLRVGSAVQVSTPRGDADAKFSVAHMVPWSRPRVFLPGSRFLAPHIRLFRASPSPLRVSQGLLGNSWLIGALAVLAESPKAVRRLFHHPRAPARLLQEQSVGAYRVTLNVNGWWRSVIVDDYFPVCGHTPCFGKSRQDCCEMWVSVLEKAYAKVFSCGHGGHHHHHNHCHPSCGSYFGIAAGDPIAAMRAFTGFPVRDFSECFSVPSGLEASTMVEHLRRYLRLGFQVLMYTSSSNSGSSATDADGNAEGCHHRDDDGCTSVGLAPGRVYALLAIRQFHQPTPAQQQQQQGIFPGDAVLLLRNPWGAGTSSNNANGTAALCLRGTGELDANGNAINTTAAGAGASTFCTLEDDPAVLELNESEAAHRVEAAVEASVKRSRSGKTQGKVVRDSSSSNGYVSMAAAREAVLAAQKRSLKDTLWVNWVDAQRYMCGCGVVYTQRSQSFDYRVRGNFALVSPFATSASFSAVSVASALGGEGNGGTGSEAGSPTTRRAENVRVPSVCLLLSAHSRVSIAITLDIGADSDEDEEEEEEEDDPFILMSLAVDTGRSWRRSFRVRSNTTSEPGCTSSLFSFQQTRSISMCVPLIPQHSPYLLIPRILTTAKYLERHSHQRRSSTPYVIGLLTASALPNASLDVNLVSLPVTSKAFENATLFSAQGMHNVSAQVQVRRPATGVVSTYRYKALITPPGPQT